MDFGRLLLLLLLVRLDPAALLGCVVSSPMARRKPSWGHALRRPGQRQVGALLLMWDTVTLLCCVSELGTGWSLQATEMGLRSRTCRKRTSVHANPERCPGHLLEGFADGNITAKVEELGSALGETETQRNPDWNSYLQLSHLFNVVAFPAFQQNI